MGSIEYVRGRELVLVAVLCFSMVLATSAGKFTDNFIPYNTDYHVQSLNNGDQSKLVLDHSAAAGFGSKNKYLFGNIGMQIKLAGNDSAGTVTCFYLSSPGITHDELDFEFLGNSSGQPYILQTNIFSNGTGGREQRIFLWFDPTADFHYYSIRWNKDIIVFYVDHVPIRAFKNNEALGVAYLNKQPLGIYTSIWNGDQWATEGGRIKLNWTSAPFIATYQGFYFNACKHVGTNTIATCAASSYASPTVSNTVVLQSSSSATNGTQTYLTFHQRNQLKWVKRKYLNYNYCADSNRTPPLHPNVQRRFCR